MKFEQIRSATSIVTYAGVRFLIDPMLADKFAYPAIPTTINCAKGNPTCDLPCKLDYLFDVDAVIVTHLHFDHFDKKAIESLPKELPLISPTKDEASKLCSYGFTKVICAEDCIIFKGIKITPTLCEHGDSDPVVKDIFLKKGITGEAHGFVLESEKENGALYLAGDTIFYDEVKKIIDKFKPFVITVNAACAQMAVGHSIMMGLDDIRTLCSYYPNAHVIATHLDGVSHATVSSEILRKYVAIEQLTKVYVPHPLEEVSV